MATSSTHPAKPDLSEARRLFLERRLKGMTVSEQKVAQVQRRNPGEEALISVDQYRIWLHHSMHPDLPTYNEPFTISHDGPLDPAIIKASFEFYAQRHEAWRTSFVETDGWVLQKVRESVDVPVQFFDLSGLPFAESEAEERRLATAQAIIPFDLRQGPLLRVLVIRRDAQHDCLHLVAHHIMFDGLSLRDSLMPELALIYTALADGKEPDLPTLELQYADYSLWREKQLSSPSMEQATHFWRDQLAGDLDVIRLPMDRPRPASISYRGGMEKFTFSAELTGALRAMGQKHGATLYMTLLASLQVLLFRYGGQEDVVIGTGANGRRLPELAGMMGYMLDTFPVRSHAKADEPFTNFLTQVRGTLFNAMEAAEVPFNHIVKAAKSKRNPSYHPIFQTFFSFLPPMREPVVGWDLQAKTVNTGTAKFDLYIEAGERGDGFAGCIVYNSDLFDVATIERLSGHWRTMLEAIVQAPETTLGELPLLTTEERETMLVRWNQTAVPVPATTMHDLFSEQALRTPDVIAVAFEKVRLTYAQLNSRAERFAVLLRDAGAGPGKLVAICIDRSENLLAGLLGILKTGAAYLPLDPGTPLARLTMCLEDADPVVLVTQRELVDRLPESNAKILLIDELVQTAAKLPVESKVAAHQAGPEDTAYIIHTSGSTGRPKAVELPHGAVVNLLLSMQREPGMKATDVLVAVTTISFDIAVLEMFLPIITGARVVIAPRTTALDPFELSDLIDESGCTMIQATPATWRAMMAIEWPGKRGLKVLCGGEALTRDLAQKLMACKVELWNVYGPTETTIWSTARRVQNRPGTVPIGRPIDNTTTYILDANQKPVPIGVLGELYIGGMGLAKGYRGQPELTAEKFVTLEITDGKRVYRTGDYALYRVDGTIECQGRADNQVKVRGYRIELEEVELHLSAHPQVVAAAARVWQDGAVGNRLTGYIVGKGGKAPQMTELRQFLQGRLPEYMVPTDFVVLDAMPLTPNGKTDRKALPADGVRMQASSAQPEESMTEDEKKLATIWADVLGVQSVGRHDDFFGLGGHSLLLIVMFSRINQEFGSNLPITTIFDAKTLSALANALHGKVRITSLVPVQTKGTKVPFFMAHSYLLYHALSSRLGNDQPFYGLRESKDDGSFSIEQRAQHYLEAMRRVQPHGPYRIAGWCAAGPLAVEIARQALLQGEQARLLLFDAWLPDYYEEVKRAERSNSPANVIRAKLRRFAAKCEGLSPTQKVVAVCRLIKRKVKDSRDSFYIRHWAAVSRWSARFHIPLPQFMHNTTAQTFAAMRGYQADRLPVKITLLRAKDSLHLADATETCGWERVADKGVEVMWAPGDHETMFRGAKLGVTAKLVQQALDEADVVRFPSTPSEIALHCGVKPSDGVSR